VIFPPPDFPSYLGLGKGILVRGATKAIALSQRLCLTIGDPGGSFGHTALQADDVKENNLAFAARAERFIISANEALLKNIVTMLDLEK